MTLDGTQLALALSTWMIADTEILMRLAAAATLGSLVGFERERLLWSAGIRTHMLVAVGAALLMIVSAYGFQSATLMPHVVLDPSRMAAQVVSGIGFLGAGAILLRGNTVRGMTTAASIWTVAAIGLAAGGGLYFAAGIATTVVLLILAGLKPLEDAYRARVQSCVLHITAERGVLSEGALKKVLRVRGGQLRRLVVTPVDGEQDRSVLHLARVSQADIRVGAARLRALPGVQEVMIDRKHRSP